MPERLPNQASFEFDENKNSGESQVILNSGEISMLHAHIDDPKGKFDIIIEDQVGNIQYQKKDCNNPTGRWGERIDLPLTDNYYKIKLENVSGCKNINVFVD